MTKRYWWHLLAVSLGTFLGLLFAQIAGEAQHPKGSVGTFPLPKVIAMSGRSLVVTVKPHVVWEAGTIQHFELWESGIGIALVTADQQTETAKLLRAAMGKRVRIQVEPEPERLTR